MSSKMKMSFFEEIIFFVDSLCLLHILFEQFFIKKDRGLIVFLSNVVIYIFFIIFAQLFFLFIQNFNRPIIHCAHNESIHFCK
jgi:hypothetical protein